ncbi:MAG: flagellar hook-length control protein FliK [Epulopiscium sp.]|nr:flagellar hook-length control protein FliK [Candidatus Epulonipiscium sp.]
MNVQATMFEFSQVNTMQQANLSKTSSSKEDFSRTLEKTQKNQEENSKSKNEINKEKGKERTDNNKVEVNKEAKSEKINKDTNDTTSKEIAESEEIIAEEMPDEEQVIQVMEDIAALLQITPQELGEILEALQIGLADLLQGDNLQKLMVEVYKLEDPMDLLEIPGIVSDITMIKSMLEESSLLKLEVKAEEEILTERPVFELNEVLEDNKVGNPKEGTPTNLEEAPGTVNEKKLEDTSKVLDSKSKTENLVEEDLQAVDGEQLFEGNEGFTTNQDNLANDFASNLYQAVEDAFQINNDGISNLTEARSSYGEIVNSKLVLDQIVEKIKVATVDENPMMNIQLKPEHLGKLTMEVVSKQGLMTAQFKVESDKTKEVLEQNIQQLRETLEAKGLIIDELEVTVEQNQGESSQEFSRPKVKRNISDIIDNIMNEDIGQEEKQASSQLGSIDSEVDYIA